MKEGQREKEQDEVQWKEREVETWPHFEVFMYL